MPHPPRPPSPSVCRPSLLCPRPNVPDPPPSPGSPGRPEVSPNFELRNNRVVPLNGPNHLNKGATLAQSSVPASVPRQRENIPVPPYQEDADPYDPSSRDSRFSVNSATTQASSVFSGVHRTASTSTSRTYYSLIGRASIDSPITLTSPYGVSEKRKDSFDPGYRYDCTFCDLSFETKSEWRDHELQSHGNRDKYLCKACYMFFDQFADLAAHCERDHADDAPPSAWGVDSRVPTRKAWGCGFCVSPFFSHDDYLDHVAVHYDDKKDMSQWQHSAVIKALLHQPGLEDSWKTLVGEQEARQETKLRFSWDPVNPEQSPVSPSSRDPTTLQTILEYFEPDKEDPRKIAETAYHAAQIRTERDVSGLYVTDGRVWRIQHPSNPSQDTVQVASPLVSEAPEDISAYQPLPTPRSMNDTSFVATLPTPSQATGNPTSYPSSRPLSRTTWSTPFSSHAARRPGVAEPTSRVLAKIEETTPAHSFVIQVADPIPGHLGKPVVSRDPFKQTILRRIDSDRNIALTKSGTNLAASGTEELVGPQTALGLHSSVSAGSSSKHLAEREMFLQAQPTISQAPLRLATDSYANEWLLVSSPRSRSGSSLFSMRTTDSPSERVSDDSFSEPDSWAELSDRPEGSQLWAAAFHPLADKVIDHIWAQYNLRWDALINECAGDQNGRRPQGRESRARVHKSGSGHVSGRGLRPSSRRRGVDEEEDEEDGEGQWPTTSQSRHSSGSSRKVACPFRKHDPVTYNLQIHEICAIRSWTSVSRMKEHLYRRHCKVYCERCKQIFRDDRELDAHKLLPISCEVRRVSHPADITASQEKQLKTKKYRVKGLSEEEKWREVYRLLFPHETVMPSPYPEVAEDLKPISPEARTDLEFHHFLLTEVPRLFEQAAEEHIGRPIGSRDSLAMESVHSIITDSLHRAFREWGARGNPSPRTSPCSFFPNPSTVSPPNQFISTPAMLSEPFGTTPQMTNTFQPQSLTGAYWPYSGGGEAFTESTPRFTHDEPSCGFVENLDSFAPATSQANYGYGTPEFPVTYSQGGPGNYPFNL
ncbi:hypothetical protein B0H67DRAFT_108307 [Lasiosphaeris hirsuta]|uniref:C2H2-type domain-containing protein n=1 Tax=Lasiosphaeris hirsuta TaxID=260670 RepID=A0AA40AYY6_9PEZI|nr:hypothetical protein B0H67DRAFT_108307 [Lasiosphaeris hirsuta]